MPFSITGQVTLHGRGRSNVAVSNGESVARTDRAGRYRLRIDPARHRFVFVVTPDGTKSTGEFYRPTDGWDRAQEGIEFVLEPAPERSRRAFTFAQITDLHIQVGGRLPPSSARLREDLRQAVSESSPAFLVATGDLTNLGDLPSMRRYRQIIASLPCPVFSMFGGHDGLAEVQRPGHDPEASATRHYEAVLGPAWYSFDWGGRHFVIHPNEDRFFAVGEREAKARWLTADLRAHAGRETLFFTHVPPAAEFVDRLSRSGVVAIFHGHWHSSKHHVRRGVRVFATSCFPFGGIDTTPRGFRRVTVQGGGFRTRLIPVAPPSDPQPVPIRRVGRTLRLLWSRPIDTTVHRAAPVVAGDHILLSLCDEEGEGRQGVLCLDLKTGRPRWRAATDASVKNAVAVADGRVVAVSAAGRVHAFDLATGAKTWQADLPGRPDRWIYTSPAVADGTVYAGGKGGYGAFDLRSGASRWYTRPTPTDSDAWSCYAGPVIVGDLLILLVQRVGIVALDRHTGREAWRLDLPVDYMDAKPALASGLIFTCGKPGELTAIRAATGEIVWRRKITLGLHLPGLGADESAVYATALSGDAVAYGLSGRRKWTFRFGADRLDMSPYRRAGRVATGGPVPAGDRVALGATDGCLRLLDRRTGRETDRWQFGSPVAAAPAVAGNRLVAACYDGLVACFEIG